MKYAWLFIFPFVFMPSFNMSRQTPLGLLEVGDMVMPFLLIALVVGQKSALKQEMDAVRWPALGFVAWAILGVITIPLRFSSDIGWQTLMFSLAKVFKFLEYGGAAFLIVRCLTDMQIRRRWNWSILGALWLLSAGLFDNPADVNQAQAFSNYNAVSVTISILVVYVVCTWFDNRMGQVWKKAAVVTVVTTLFALMITVSTAERHGRGGWLGLFCGVVYLFFSRSRSYKSVLMICSVAVVLVVGYFMLPSFRSLVNFTRTGEELRDENGFESKYGMIDQGGRVSTWVHEAPKLWAHPIIGTGFYYRQEAGLWDSGSHNFFIQMFLETGIVGGVLLLIITWRLWAACGKPFARLSRYATPCRAAIISACVSGMTGEYYYGGLPLLVAIAVLAPALSLPALTDRQLALALAPAESV